MADSIDISKQQEIIIVEKLDGNGIGPDSHLYCGMCGHTLGVTINSMTFPFNSRQLVENMKFRTFIHGFKLPNSGKSLRGLVHSTCQQPMFVQQPWNFIGLDEYNKNRFRDKIMLR